MAHLVPNPPPANYQVPTLSKFSIMSPDGIGTINAWGLNPGLEWRVGTDNPLDVVSTMSSSSHPGLFYFELRGVKKGYKIAIFLKQGGGWVRYSPYVDVESNLADTYAAAFAAGKLPKSKFSNQISFYPFGSQQAYEPMAEADWMDSVEAALRKISNNTIGRAVLKNIKSDTVIYPFLEFSPNAYSTVLINPKQWKDGFDPGSSVDEILLHELIHVVEKDARNYKDMDGFLYDKTDFLTVNATNVYSCMLGRALRKDHRDLALLPDEYFRNPKLHWERQSINYQTAAGNAGNLVRTLASIEGVWNPFRYWSDWFETISFGH